MTAIRILENEKNRLGDLFGQLMADLFVALGYEQPRLNIHKSGREIDIFAQHRLERRRAVGECKATAIKTGGDDVNKFIGALDAEHDDETPITGYFISLSGFKETAIEQENKRKHTKIILLTGADVVKELMNGRILITKDRATELAGRLCSGQVQLILDPNAELLAHKRGWVWAIYYTEGKHRTHFSLIHADGTPLAQALAQEVIASDKSCKGKLHELVCLNPLPQPVADKIQDAKCLSAYARYLTEECGSIQLDGLPADSDVGSRKMRLENLFVPLNLDVPSLEKLRQPVGVILEDHPRLALLAAPGGGKSTLIKRLAVAYIDSSRRSQVADNLPQRDWLPLFFRCRELRDLARASFAELVEALSQKEPIRQYASVFRAHVDRALLDGRVLLLVDGLDEISTPGDRAAFVCTIRSALQAYPGTAIVVTSREAGFRHVAAHLAPICTHATLSPFNAEDIRNLSVAWHREVVGDTEKVRADAEQLATTIGRNDRIQRLAVNPLLLTTLLLVKRWVGSLPTRRAVLYGKAVEVLLITWNTEGHDPFPEEEALPQLCYLASAMMLNGIERISRPRLTNLIQEARKALPTELGYVKGSVEEFIHRIEDRSSLLMMTGHDVEDGKLVEFFEFRHLTFQEFLTARAIVEGWHPGRKDDDTLVSVLELHFDDEKWREVIPLAAVLGGKNTEALIQVLTKKIKNKPDTLPINDPTLLALVNCLADEAAARPETIREALQELMRFGSTLQHIQSAQLLVRGRYGADFRNAARKAYLATEMDFAPPANALILSVYDTELESHDANPYGSTAKAFFEKLNLQDEASQCEGVLGLGKLCHEIHLSRPDDLKLCRETLLQAGPILVTMLMGGRTREVTSAAYALGALGSCRIWIPPALPDVMRKLFELWQQTANKTLEIEAVRAYVLQPIVPRDKMQLSASIFKNVKKLLKKYDDLEPDKKMAILITAWYTKALENAEIIKRIRELKSHPSLNVSLISEVTSLNEIMEQLGEKL